MRIAVACQGLDVAPRFARSSSFMCYRVDRGMFADCQNMPNLSFPPAQLAQVLKDLDVSVMIVDRIDPTSETALKAAGIEVQPATPAPHPLPPRTYIGRTLSGTHEELEAS